MKHESDSAQSATNVPAWLSRFADWSNDGDVGGYRIGDGSGGGTKGIGGTGGCRGMNSNVKQKHRVTNGVYSRRHCFKWLSDARNLSRFATWQAPLNLFIQPRSRAGSQTQENSQKSPGPLPPCPPSPSPLRQPLALCPPPPPVRSSRVLQVKTKRRTNIGSVRAIASDVL